MEIKWILDFLSLARTHSFSRSAEERNVTQSALSRRIQALEAWIGAELVDRRVQPIRLTVAGILFHKQAEDVLRQLINFRSMLQSLQQLESIQPIDSDMCHSFHDLDHKIV